MLHSALEKGLLMLLAVVLAILFREAIGVLHSATQALLYWCVAHGGPVSEILIGVSELANEE